jgi:hypothetical protein
MRSARPWGQLIPHRHRRGGRLRRLSFIPVLVVDEVGYIPFDPEAANLMFSLVSRPLRARQPDRHLKQAVLRLGRDLRRRDDHGRDDRPARPPRRNPLPQGRQLPPKGPRPRPTARPPGPRNTLTKHKGPPRREPQKPLRGPVFSPEPPKPPPEDRSAAGSVLRSALRASLHTQPARPQGGCIFNRRGGQFQPADTTSVSSQVAHFSAGLDMCQGLFRYVGWLYAQCVGPALAREPWN